MSGLAGLVVIDVVEGTAMDALSSMQSFLRSRPQNFNSLQNAIEWRSAQYHVIPIIFVAQCVYTVDTHKHTSVMCLRSPFSYHDSAYCHIINFRDFSVRSGQTRNVEAARVSMPGQVKK